jgi:phage tail tape-measure protein
MRSAMAVFAEFIRTVRQEFANGRKVSAERHAAIVSQQDRFERQLSEMRGIVVEAMEKHGEHRAHVLDGFDRLGTRMQTCESKLRDLEASNDPAE